jgi:hypothetical protein
MRIAMILLLGIAAVGLVLEAGPEAKTLTVSRENNDLWAALREATYGDTVLVYPGIYRLQARLRSGVKLLSVEGPDSTILQNDRWHILKLNDCDIETKVSGFTFNGRGSNVCIACTTGAPLVVDNVIKDSWDGLSFYQCNAFVKGNTITGCNRGIYMDYSDPEVVETTIFKNADGISMISSAPVIARCRLERNGRAILIQGHSYPTIGGMLSTANDIVNNSFNLYNAGLRIDGTQYTDQREVAVATHNYWGSDCPNERRMRGDVIYKPWTNAEHDTTLEVCPEPPPDEVEKQ